MDADQWLECVGDPDRLRALGCCVVEGTEAVRQLLLSPFEVEMAVAVPGRAVDLQAAWQMRQRQGDIVARPRSAIGQALGRRFLRGALAVAQRPPLRQLDTILAALPQTARWSAIALDRISDPANVGSIIRSARCLGLDAILLGKGCADPFYRQALRTGMGHGFHLPVIDCPDLAAAISTCSDHHIPTFSAALDGIECPSPLPTRWILAMGNEDLGVSPAVRAVTSGALRIPMATGCDSLSVAVAAAVLADRLRR